MTRLPVLYVSQYEVFDAGNISGHHGNIIARLERNPRQFTPYEPAVPRCKTCRHWQADFDANDELSGHYCDKCVGVESDDDIPQDGSGYCYRHKEANQ